MAQEKSRRQEMEEWHFVIRLTERCTTSVEKHDTVLVIDDNCRIQANKLCLCAPSLWRSAYSISFGVKCASLSPHLFSRLG